MFSISEIFYRNTLTRWPLHFSSPGINVFLLFYLPFCCFPAICAVWYYSSKNHRHQGYVWDIELSWKVLSKLGSFHDCLNSVHHLILEAYVLTQKNSSFNDYKKNYNWCTFYFQSIFSQSLKIKSSFDLVSGFCGISLPHSPFFTLCLIPRSRPGPHF